MNIPKEIFFVAAQNSVDAIIAIDEKGRVIFWNQAAEHIFGYSFSEMKGKVVHEILMPSEYLERYRKGFEIFQKTGMGPAVGKVLELEALKKSGEKFPIEITVVPIKRREGYWAVAIIRDITKKQERIRYFSDIYRATEEILENLNFEERAKRAVTHAVKIFRCSYGWIGKIENGNLKILGFFPEEILYAKNVEKKWNNSAETILEKYLAEKALISGNPELVQDIFSDPDLIFSKNEKEYKFKSLAVFPLILKGELLGILSLYSNQKDFFEKERFEYIKAFIHRIAMLLKNAELVESLQRQIERIEALRAIDITIAGSTDLRVVSHVVLGEIVEQLKVDAAVIFLVDPYSENRVFHAKRGFYTDLIEKTSPKGPTFNKILKEKRIICIPDLRKVDKSVFGRKELAEKEGFVSYYGVPLISKGNLLGVLEVFFRSEKYPHKDWIYFLEILAGQIAIAVENARIIEKLHEKHTSLVKAYEETIMGWGSALALKTEETQEHCQRVTELTVELAQKLGIKGEDLLYIKWGAILHDIGKIGIPDNILLKPGELTPEEWEIMKKHPEYAYKMLSPIKHLSRAIDIPYCHHEKWDGTGYPRGLKGKEIPIAARIFAVVDVYDALTHDRPYRKAWTKEEALEYIKNQKGKHFDPDVVDAFLELLESKEFNY